MPAATLLKMATATAIKLVSQIDDMGKVPYHLARPILLRIQNPQQLRDFEIANPEIAESDEEIWRASIARDIQDWESKIIVPKNPSNWHKVYAKLQRAEQRKAEADEEALRKTLQGETLKKASNETVFVAKVLPHKREFNTGMVDGVRKNSINTWVASKQPTLKNAKTGKDAMAAIRRQTAQAAKVKSHSQPIVRATKSQQLNDAKRQITAAPVGMVQDLARTRQPLAIAPRELLPHERDIMRERQAAQNINRIIPPTRRGATQVDVKKRTTDVATQQARAAKEARLRALTQPQTQKRAAPLQAVKRFEFSPPPAADDAARNRLPVTTVPKDEKSSAERAALGFNQSETSAASPPQASAAQSVSPQSSPAPTKMVRKRPATSIFAPPIKKRKM